MRGAYWVRMAERCAAIGGEVAPTPLIWPPQVAWIGIQQRREAHRLSLYIAQWGVCFWCTEEMSVERYRLNSRGEPRPNDRFASFEHLLRRSQGGTFSEDNIRVAHAGCNRKRDAKAKLERYLHDPHPIRTHHVRDVHARDAADDPRGAARTRRRSVTDAKAILAGGARLHPRPVAPVVPGKPAVAAPVAGVQAVRRRTD